MQKKPDKPSRRSQPQDGLVMDSGSKPMESSKADTALNVRCKSKPGQLPRGRWLKQQAAHARLQRLISAPFAVAAVFLPVVLFYLIPDFPLTLLLALLFVITLAAVGVYWYIGAAHRRYAFLLDDLSLRIRKGVVWQKETAVPLDRVQHTDVTQGPLQRRYGLATLVIHTAGTRHAVVNLEGVTLDQALALRQALSFDANNSAV